MKKQSFVKQDRLCSFITVQITHLIFQEVSPSPIQLQSAWKHIEKKKKKKTSRFCYVCFFIVLSSNSTPPSILGHQTAETQRDLTNIEHWWLNIHIKIKTSASDTCILLSSTTGPCWRSLTIVACTTFRKAAS